MFNELGILILCLFIFMYQIHILFLKGKVSFCKKGPHYSICDIGKAQCWFQKCSFFHQKGTCGQQVLFCLPLLSGSLLSSFLVGFFSGRCCPAWMSVTIPLMLSEGSLMMFGNTDVIN